MRLYKVIGVDDLEGLTFAQCTTHEKAKKAQELIEENGFENCTELVQDELPLDTIEIDGKLISL